MHLRRDALAGAARLVAAVEDVCAAPRATPVVGTVGVIDAKPGAMNVIPGEATLWIDLRSTSLADRTACRDAVLAEARRLAEARGLQLEVTTLMEDAPVPMAAEVTELLAGVCAEQAIDHLVMDSGAGHDAMQMAAIARAGMLFIPCREGISHNPREWTSTEEIALGAEVLLQATLRLAGGDA
jgi:N-carbamoyl-L-amino-acid hydrolase